MNRKLYPLCENHIFAKAYRKGKSAVNKYTAVYVLKNYRKDENGNPVNTKLGISVNAKLGKACKRSRVKRMIRHAYMANLDDLKRGYFVIIAARTACFNKGVKSTDIEKQLKATLQKLEVIE